MLKHPVSNKCFVLALFGIFLGTCRMLAQANENDTYLIGDPNCRVVNQSPQDNERITWSGACKDGFADGKGVLLWFRGEEKTSSYEGELRRGLPNGHGVYQYSSKARFEGEFKDGFGDEGVLTSPDGTKLKATFVRGVATGYGEQTFPDGAWYRGDWKNGKYDGKGKRQFSDGVFYEGEFKAGWRDGKGTATYKNGNRYEGNWSNGNYDGIGTMHYASGAIYSGGWKLGKYDGKGKVTNADGSVGDVEYKDGVRIDPQTAKLNESYATRVLRSTNAIAEYAGPYDSAKGRKAFAQSPLGVWADATNLGTVAEAKAAALERCRQNTREGEPPCLIVDVDGDLINSANAEQWQLALVYAGNYVETMLATIDAPDSEEYGKAASRIIRLARPSRYATRDAIYTYEKGAKKNNAGDYEAAVGPLREAAAVSPGVADIQYALAVALLNAGHYEEARPALTSDLALRISDTKAWRAEARLSAKTNNLQRARQALLAGFENSTDKNDTIEDYRTGANDETDDVLRKAYQDVLPAAEARFDAWHAKLNGRAPSDGKASMQLSGGQSSLWKMIGNACGKPEYPFSARRNGAEGETVVALHVGERGEVQDVVIVQSAGNWDLDEATRHSVQSCQFALPSPQYDPDQWAEIVYRWKLDASGKK